MKQPTAFAIEFFCRRSQSYQISVGIEVAALAFAAFGAKPESAYDLVIWMSLVLVGSVLLWKTLIEIHITALLRIRFILFSSIAALAMVGLGMAIYSTGRSPDAAIDALALFFSAVFFCPFALGINEQLKWVRSRASHE